MGTEKIKMILENNDENYSGSGRHPKFKTGDNSDVMVPETNSKNTKPTLSPINNYAR
jgi:hypothetical protein